MLCFLAEEFKLPGFLALLDYVQVDDEMKITFPGKVKVRKITNEKISLYEYMKTSSLTIIHENTGKLPNQTNVYSMECMGV